MWTTPHLTTRLTLPSAITAFILMLASLIPTAHAQNTTTTTPQTLNITAISTRNTSSVLQCWQLLPPLTAISTPGTAGALNLPLSNATNISYTVIPARFDGGIHHAPARQWVVFLSGLARISVPGVEGEAWVQGGKYGVVFAGDVAGVGGVGHRTEYPGEADTVVLSVPLGEGEGVPAHRVLYEGGCRWGELVGV